jgi:hypothetical protein
MESLDAIDRISFRARQVVAAICLDRFCTKYGVSHPSFSQFIEHLWGFATVSGPGAFVEWDRGFGKLEVTGLGDPIPDKSLAGVPGSIRHDLEILVESASEIVMCDAYGAATDASNVHLRAIFDVLRRHRVSIPDLAPFAASPAQEMNGWGAPVSREVLDQWRVL